MTTNPRDWSSHSGADYEHEYDRDQPRWIVKLAWLIFSLAVIWMCWP